MRSHGGKSGAGRGSGRGMKTRKRVGRRPGCGAENFSAGRGRSAVARKTSRQVGRGSGVSAVREPRLPRGKSVGGAPAFRPQVGRCFCGGAENFSAGRARKRRFSGAGTTAAARKICRRSSGIPAAGRTVFLWWPENFSAGRARKRRFRVRGPRLPRGKSVGGAPAFRPQCERYGSWPDAVSAARKIWREPSPSRLRETCRRGSGPVRSSRCPPPSGDGSYSASVKAMPCSASSE